MKSPKSAMVTAASGEPRTFQSLAMGGVSGVESGEGVSAGAEVDGGTRVFVGTGAAVAVGSTGSGSEEQAHAAMAREATQKSRMSNGRGRGIMAML